MHTKKNIMKKKLLKNLMIFGLLSLLTSSAFATTYYVATTGSDSNPGTSASPFRTIKYAYSKVAAGDMILVRPGKYTDYQSGWACT